MQEDDRVDSASPTRPPPVPDGVAAYLQPVNTGRMKFRAATLGFIVPITTILMGLAMAPGDLICFKCSDPTTDGEALAGMVLGAAVAGVILHLSLPDSLQYRWAWALMGLIGGPVLLFLIALVLGLLFSI